MLNFCKLFNCILILLGDPNQLPPIGKGQPLTDIVDSNLFEINKLDEIMRNSGLLKTTINDICLGKQICKSITDSSIVYIDLECMDGDDEISEYFKTFIEKHNQDKYNTKIYYST